jgi:predicted amidohydrolase YtcJ
VLDPADSAGRLTRVRFPSPAPLPPRSESLKRRDATERRESRIDECVYELRRADLACFGAVTFEAADSLRTEKDLGSIVPGKLANFTILADNPLTLDPM